ncbi:hypothetical protein MFFDBJGM_00685 [Pectobacterium versatile]|jgi:O-antigen/teichoic acid export membrane protein|uniref:hypothetical protein n=1 Tax=Pectobacterium versatile TaxID=2488639 RepID=UPI000DAB3711|nr:hypothetical protein [Pectobacterium versatile]GBO47682.1 hypothetical protein MFFDBJGM_00685 [Pectobacterium versatile]
MKNDNKLSLINNFKITIFLLILSFLLIWALNIEHPMIILVPILITACFFYRLIKIKDKTERDVIKSANDTVLFSITAITTSFLSLNTLTNYNIDLFGSLMKGEAMGCIAIFYYTILLVIKASIARFELNENLNKYNLEKK